MLQTEVLALLEAGMSVFITGAAGAGKTYVLNRAIRAMRDQGLSVAVTASTGIAATHLNGRTIHSWSGVGVAECITSQLMKTIRSRRRKQLQAADVLVIDEVSMMHAWLLDMVEEVCRTIRRDDRPFGGLQVVLSGDFFQLPPVSVSGRNRDLIALSDEFIAARDRYAQSGKNPEGFISESFAWDALNPTICYLTEQHRQDHGRLLQVLNDIRADRVTDEDRHILTTRVGLMPEKMDVSVHLFPTNKQADELNNRQLAALDGDAHEFTSSASGPLMMVDKLKKSMLAPEHLVLKIGATVMALRNDQNKQYVNGSLGTVVNFTSEKQGGWPIVEFENGHVVTIKPVCWEMMDGETVLASVAQVPLRCAWAITIHKSQGMTLERAVMDLRRTFAPGMGYVALSRVEKLSGLYLQGLSDRVFLVSQQAVDLDGALRNASEQVSNRLACEGIASLSRQLQELSLTMLDDDEFSLAESF